MTTFLNKIKIKNAIKNTIKTVKEKFETQTSLLEKKNIHCSIDKEEVDCDEMNAPVYVGVPAPMYLEDDPWFGSASVKTQKQIDYMKEKGKPYTFIDCSKGGCNGMKAFPTSVSPTGEKVVGFKEL